MMINALSFLFVFLSFVTISCSKQNTSTDVTHSFIKGILPYKNQMLYLSTKIIDEDYERYKPLDSVLTDDKGNFSMNPLCSPESIYVLRTSSESIVHNIFCRSDDTIIIRQLQDNSKPEIISDKGGATKFYKYFYSTYPVPQEFFTKLQEKRWKDCFTIMDALTQKRASVLMMNTLLLNKYPALKKELGDVVHFSANHHKLNLLMYLYYDDNDSIIIQDEHCLDFIKNINLYIDNKPLTMAYSQFINTYLEFPYKTWRLEQMKTKQFSKEERLSLRFEFCKSNLKGTSRDYGMYYCFHSLFSFYDDTTAFIIADKQIEEMKQFVTDKRYLDLCVRMVNSKRQISAHQLAPDFTLRDLNNTTVSLSDFKGKTIYMEFTGTWCGPCRKEIPYMKELQNKCKENPNIQFLTVWLEDDNFSVWSDYVKKIGVGGVHLYSESQFKGEVPRKYLVSSVPRFIIIDGERRIVNPSTRPPSDEGVYGEIIQTSIVK